MFAYRPPKASCWGHSIRSNDPLIVKQRIDAFFDAYFERIEQDEPMKYVLAWKDSVLPNTAWPEEFSKPENINWKHILFMVMGNKLMFPAGLFIPVSLKEPASYKFLRRFSTEAPFKMNSKHFQVGITGKTGKLSWRKPDAEIEARLRESIL